MPTLERYIVTLFDNEFEAEGETRAKAVTKAIQEYKRTSDNQIPITVLRNLAKTRKASTKDVISEQTVEKMFK